ncbi:lytic transglycosylase domain-containing protein [Candidatus Halobeggiatoa sp. HSG11]|nr:lytic transglycosylase domain-containing protein [Candidatus Halobeggiatoa sp. HSG11]
MILWCFLFIFAINVNATESTIIYKYYDTNGVLHLTNKAPKKKNKLLYARSYLIPPSQVNFKINNKYSELITKAANKAQLSPALLHAIVQVESAYNSKAISPKGAVGLMQLMPATAKRYGVKDRTNPTENLAGGTRYFRDLLTMFNGNLSLALAAYNAGENAVKRYKNTIPPYKETQNYVKKINKLYTKFSQF